VARLQIPAAPINPSAGGTGIRGLFHVLRDIRDCAWPVFFSTIPADVPRWFPLRLRFFVEQSLVKNQFWQVGRGRCNSRVTNSNSSSKKLPMVRPLAVIFGLISITRAFAVTPVDTSSQLIVSVRDQKLMLVQNGGKVATYPVSTSMFGLGDAWGRMTTPLGYLAVEKKIGDNAPTGAVFHNRRLTGEVLQPNTPGRDPITTRIIWLRGLEAQNAHAFQRCIYIHGTPQEKTIGRPASYGCIRMKSSDVAELYDRVPVGTLVQITPERLPKVAKPPRSQPTNTFVAASPKPQSQDQTISTQASGATLSVDQMRMRGALAAQRQKAKLALNKRL
jgi:lipoprotein-anchoring transpeptidase ErfK/SrfK